MAQCLRLRTRGDGRVEVLLPALPPGAGDALPSEVARDLIALPGRVGNALG